MVALWFFPTDNFHLRKVINLYSAVSSYYEFVLHTMVEKAVKHFLPSFVIPEATSNLEYSFHNSSYNQYGTFIGNFEVSLIVREHNSIKMNINHNKIACSQTLYFLFKVRRARVIKNKPRGIYWPPAQGGRGGCRLLASLARSFLESCFPKERKER